MYLVKKQHEAWESRGLFLERSSNLSGPKSNFWNYDPLAVKSCSFNMFRYKEMQNNCQVSKLETCSYWRCKGISVTQKVSGRSRNGPLVPLCLITISVLLFYLQLLFCLRFAFLIAFHFFFIFALLFYLHFTFLFAFCFFYLRFAFLIVFCLFVCAFNFTIQCFLFFKFVLSFFNLCFLFLICIFFFYLCFLFLICFLFCFCLTLLGHRNLELDHVYKIIVTRIFNYRIDVKFPCFK